MPDAFGGPDRPRTHRLGLVAGVWSVTGVGVAVGAIGFVITGEPLWIAAGAVAGATLEWIERSKK